MALRGEQDPCHILKSAFWGRSIIKQYKDENRTEESAERDEILRIIYTGSLCPCLHYSKSIQIRQGVL